MGTLEALLAQIVALSGNPDDLGGLQTTLKAPQADNVMRQNAGGLLAAAASLDAAAHSLGCLYLLEAKARTSNAQQGDRDFLEAACRFLTACAEQQVRLAPEKCECLAAGRVVPAGASIPCVIYHRLTDPTLPAPPSLVVQSWRCATRSGRSAWRWARRSAACCRCGPPSPSWGPPPTTCRPSTPTSSSCEAAGRPASCT